MRIIDTHLHLVYPDQFSYPWLTGEPSLNRQWPAEAYFAEAAGLGIEAALHMEVDVAETDMFAESEFVLGLDRRIVGAIAACRPEAAEFPAYLEKISGLQGVRGLRRVLHVVPDAVSQAPLFVENIRRLATRHLPFDLCVRADQLPLAEALADKAPQVQFVLDHCGVPKVTEKQLEPWRSEIRALARRPNVAAKISGVIAYAGPDWAVEDLRPFVEHVIESFGWERVVWGSDHPVCTQTASLTRWVEATRQIIAGASADEQARLWHRNAEHFYRL